MINLTQKIEIINKFLADAWEAGDQPYLVVRVNEDKPWATRVNGTAYPIENHFKKDTVTLNLTADAVGAVGQEDSELGPVLAVQMRFSGEIVTVMVPFISIAMLYDKVDSEHTSVHFHRILDETFLIRYNLLSQAYGATAALINRLVKEVYNYAPAVMNIIDLPSIIPVFHRAMVELEREYFVQLKVHDGKPETVIISPDVLATTILSSEGLSIGFLAPTGEMENDVEKYYELFQVPTNGEARNIVIDNEAGSILNIFTEPDSSGKSSVYLTEKGIVIADKAIMDKMLEISGVDEVTKEEIKQEAKAEVQAEVLTLPVTPQATPSTAEPMERKDNIVDFAAFRNRKK